MTSFAEVTRQVRQINDLILSDMKNGNNDQTVHSASQTTRTHLCATKDWFLRISWANKKKFLLVLIDDVKKIWTLSLLLKSIWNCRPKDAVMSVCEKKIWSSYDQIPMDHDRTALPKTKLMQVMSNDRRWFQSLEPEDQALVLTELLTISGGPIMWDVMKRAEKIYQQHQEIQLQNLQECEVVIEPPPEKKSLPEPVKKDQTPRRKSSISQSAEAKAVTGQAQKELEINLSQWASTVKSIKDSLKLEELEMTFKDGTKKKVWKVNRPKPEIVETADMIQLLPSSISKRIFMYLPQTQLGDCAKVNKYWSFLVDEMKAEFSARQKIDIELEKLRDNIMRHEPNVDLMSKSEFNEMTTMDSSSMFTKTNERSNFTEKNKPSTHSFGAKRRTHSQKKPGYIKPFRDLTDLNERLERRGATDESLWKWCSNVIKINKNNIRFQNNKQSEGLLTLENPHFPSCLMSQNLKIPLNPPLTVDPSDKIHIKPTSNITQSKEIEIFEKEKTQHYSLWSKDFSSLYPVCKVPSHQAPF
ncbi:uncharacterized protein LOC116773825 isoform X2 [Danaus plexippus]|uniref:uncharacterized protein LOC116773825 isoform X2 n=1 Tax=Danaus plexippus TaxID=13037 RepID=UPI002AB27389|nr:uncharacterized protein LOC116773825 isoform X2 [Danaus plexippus]